MTDTLAAYSLVAVYSAIAVYAVAFVAFVLDLAARASVAQAASAAARPSRYHRVAFALTILGWIIQVGAVALRAIAAGRVPWANLFEFTLTGTAIIVGVFLLVQLWRDLRFLGAYVTGVVVLLATLATVNFYVDVTPLPPALQSAWLVIHVLVAMIATGFFAIGGGISIVQLLQARRETVGAGPRFLTSFPASDELETIANRLIIVGFALWTFTLMAGAIWAERAWGRYWGWDTKEVWTFIIWVIFAGYVHARATRGWRGNRSAWLAIIGFAAVIFNFTIVNLFFTGLHAYSGSSPALEHRDASHQALTPPGVAVRGGRVALQQRGIRFDPPHVDNAVARQQRLGRDVAREECRRAETAVVVQFGEGSGERGSHRETDRAVESAGDDDRKARLGGDSQGRRDPSEWRDFQHEKIGGTRTRHLQRVIRLAHALVRGDR